MGSNLVYVCGCQPNSAAVTQMGRSGWVGPLFRLIFGNAPAWCCPNGPGSVGRPKACKKSTARSKIISCRAGTARSDGRAWATVSVPWAARPSMIKKRKSIKRFIVGSFYKKGTVVTFLIPKYNTHAGLKGWPRTNSHFRVVPWVDGRTRGPA